MIYIILCLFFISLFACRQSVIWQVRSFGRLFKLFAATNCSCKWIGSLFNAHGRLHICPKESTLKRFFLLDFQRANGPSFFTSLNKEKKMRWKLQATPKKYIFRVHFLSNLRNSFALKAVAKLTSAFHLSFRSVLSSAACAAVRLFLCVCFNIFLLCLCVPLFLFVDQSLVQFSMALP